MYNRYIPQPDGSYRRSRMSEPKPPEPPRPPYPLEPADKPAPPCQTPAPSPAQHKHPQPCRPERCHRNRKDSAPAGTDIGSSFKNLLPKDFDTGDLLIVLLLLLMAGDCAEDQNTALLTLALYLFL